MRESGDGNMTQEILVEIQEILEEMDGRNKSHAEYLRKLARSIGAKLMRWNPDYAEYHLGIGCRLCFESCLLRIERELKGEPSCPPDLPPLTG